MMAFVRGVIAASTLAGSMHQVSSVTSTRTGTALMSRAAAAVACHVRPGTITSSPYPTSQASSASWSVTVPFAIDSAYFVPVNRANASLNCFSRGPL